MKRTRTSSVTAVAVSIIASFLSCAAEAAPIGALEIPGCENAMIEPDAPGGDTGAASFICAIAGGGANVAGMGVVTAGRDYFSNVISPLVINGTQQQVAPGSITMILRSFPTWDPDVDMVPTRLFLSGQVRGTGTMRFSQTGLLGGPALMFDRTFTQNADVDIELFGLQAPNGVATLTLTVFVEGPIAFIGQSPTFQGEVPEPSTLVLLGTALLGLSARWRARASVGLPHEPSEFSSGKYRRAD